MPAPAPSQLTDEQRDQLLATVASLTVTVQAVAQVVAQALAPAMTAASERLAELQRVLEAGGLLRADGTPTGPSCRFPQTDVLEGKTYYRGPCIVLERHIEHVDAEGNRWTWLADSLRATRRSR